MSNLPTLQIKIENKQEIELFDFVSSMTALNDEYTRFAMQNKKQNHINDFKLYVNKVSEGSIVIDLVEKSDDQMIVKFAHFLCDSFNYFCGKGENLPANYKFEKEDFMNFCNIVSVSSKYRKNSLSIKLIMENNV